MSEAAEGMNSRPRRSNSTEQDTIFRSCIAKRRYVWHCISLPADTGNIRDSARFDRAWLTGRSLTASDGSLLRCDLERRGL